MQNSGYHDCPCPTCFEIAIGCDDADNPDMCSECDEAGCDGDNECSVEPDLDEETDDQIAEEDWVTEDYVTFCGHGTRECFVVPDVQDWRDALRAKMRGQGFFPDVWFVSDHGNTLRLTLSDVAPMDDASCRNVRRAPACASRHHRRRCIGNSLHARHLRHARRGGLSR